MDDFNEMRQQLASMKQSLDKYRIVNEKLLIKVMRQRSSWLNNYVAGEIIATPFIVFIMWGICELSQITPWVWISVSVAIAASVIVDFYTMKIRVNNIWRDNLMEFRSRLLQQKRLRRIQLIVELPLMMLWSIWFYAEYFRIELSGLTDGNAIAWFWVGFCILSIAFSAFIVLWIFRKAQRTNDSLIAEIESSEDSD